MDRLNQYIYEVMGSVNPSFDEMKRHTLEGADELSAGVRRINYEIERSSKQVAEAELNADEKVITNKQRIVEVMERIGERIRNVEKSRLEAMNALTGKDDKQGLENIATATTYLKNLAQVQSLLKRELTDATKDLNELEQAGEEAERTIQKNTEWVEKFIRAKTDFSNLGLGEVNSRLAANQSTQQGVQYLMDKNMLQMMNPTSMESFKAAEKGFNDLKAKLEALAAEEKGLIKQREALTQEALKKEEAERAVVAAKVREWDKEEIALLERAAAANIKMVETEVKRGIKLRENLELMRQQQAEEEKTEAQKKAGFLSASMPTFGAAGDALKNASKGQFNPLGAMINTFEYGAAYKMIDAVGQLASSWAQAQQNAEEFRQRMELFTGSTSKVQAIEREVDKLGFSTGFAHEKLYLAAEQMEKFGMNSQKYLPIAADLAARSGQDIDRVADAMARMSQGGRGGIGSFQSAMAELAQATGMSIDKLKLMVGASTAQVKSFEELQTSQEKVSYLFDLIGEHAAGSAEKMGETWKAKIQELQNTWDSMAKNDTGFGNFVKNIITTGVDAAKGTLKGVDEIVDVATGNAIKDVRDLQSAAQQAIKDMTDLQHGKVLDSSTIKADIDAMDAFLAVIDDAKQRAAASPIVGGWAKLLGYSSQEADNILAGVNKVHTAMVQAYVARKTIEDAESARNKKAGGDLKALLDDYTKLSEKENKSSDDYRRMHDDAQKFIELQKKVPTAVADGLVDIQRQADQFGKSLDKLDNQGIHKFIEELKAGLQDAKVAFDDGSLSFENYIQKYIDDIKKIEQTPGFANNDDLKNAASSLWLKAEQAIHQFEKTSTEAARKLDTEWASTFKDLETNLATFDKKMSEFGNTSATRTHDVMAAQVAEQAAALAQQLDDIDKTTKEVEKNASLKAEAEQVAAARTAEAHLKADAAILESMRENGQVGTEGYKALEASIDSWAAKLKQAGPNIAQTAEGIATAYKDGTKQLQEQLQTLKDLRSEQLALSDAILGNLQAQFTAAKDKGQTGQMHVIEMQMLEETNRRAKELLAQQTEARTEAMNKAIADSDHSEAAIAAIKKKYEAEVLIDKEKTLDEEEKRLTEIQKLDPNGPNASTISARLDAIKMERQDLLAHLEKANNEMQKMATSTQKTVDNIRGVAKDTAVVIEPTKQWATILDNVTKTSGLLEDQFKGIADQLERAAKALIQLASVDPSKTAPSSGGWFSRVQSQFTGHPASSGGSQADWFTPSPGSSSTGVSDALGSTIPGATYDPSTNTYSIKNGPDSGNGGINGSNGSYSNDTNPIKQNSDGTYTIGAPMLFAPGGDVSRNINDEPNYTGAPMSDSNYVDSGTSNNQIYDRMMDDPENQNRMSYADYLKWNHEDLSNTNSVGGVAGFRQSDYSTYKGNYSSSYGDFGSGPSFGNDVGPMPDFGGDIHFSGSSSPFSRPPNGYQLSDLSQQIVDAANKSNTFFGGPRQQIAYEQGYFLS